MFHFTLIHPLTPDNIQLIYNEIFPQLQITITVSEKTAKAASTIAFSKVLHLLCNIGYPCEVAFPILETGLYYSYFSFFLLNICFNYTIENIFSKISFFITNRTSIMVTKCMSPTYFFLIYNSIHLNAAFRTKHF